MRDGGASFLSRALRSAVRISVVLAVIVALIIISLWAYLWYPVRVLLDADPSLSGTQVYVDGNRACVVGGNCDILHFSLGRHTIRAHHPRYGHAYLVYYVRDDEQGSRERLLLRRKGRNLVLTVD